MTPALDLFCGMGGWTTGASKSASVRVRVALNHDADAIAWHRAAHPEVKHLQQDANDADFGALVTDVGGGILFASPTCQQDSQCGRPARAGVGGNGKVNVAELMMRNRARRSTAHAVLVAAELLEPRILLVENVVQFADWDMFPMWTAWLEKLGYHVRVHRLNAADYGSATDRERLMVTAARDGALELATNWGPGRSQGRRMRDCLDPDDHPENRWFAIDSKPQRTKSLIRAKQREYGERGILNNVSDGVRLRFEDDLAPTLTTKSGSQLMLIDGDRVRILNPRELARIHGWPSNVPLPKDRGTASRLLGNAIPVELAAGVVAQAEALN
jgi:DNA (cytosine-5)-methyltransferase 1